MIQRVSYIFLLFIILFLFPASVFSHSTVISVNPAPNSMLENPPEEVKITFHSEIDDKNFSIKMYDDQKQEIKTSKATISSNKKVLHLKLPRLNEGSYNVTYKIISAKDGHPLQDSFTFTIGHSAKTIEKDSTESKLQINPILTYLFRSVYYIGLLWIVGWVFWNIVLTKMQLPETFEVWGTVAQMVHLLGFICFILSQVIEITGNGFEFQMNSDIAAFGVTWIATLVLSFIGFFYLFKKKWFDLTWLLFIVLLKGLNSHTFEFHSSIIFVPLNILHIIFASIWASGIIYITLFWRKHRWYVTEFLPVFKKYALASILLLLLSGVFLTINIAPNLETLFFTHWGNVLLLKMLLVLLLLIIGMIIHKRMNESKPLRKWMNIDFIIMIFIIIMVAMLTYLNPLD